MASASSAVRLCMLACRRSPTAPLLPRARPLGRAGAAPRRAALSTTTRARRAAARPARDEDEAEAEAALSLTTMDRQFAEAATPEGLRQLDELAKSNGHLSIDELLESRLRDTPGWASEDRALEDELFKDDVGEKPNKSSFWYDEDDPETNTEEHDEFDEDDITSMAHGKLDEVREMRHYARLAVWEMPLLANLAKPFAPPTPDQVLRWRYTTYMGEAHPAEKKVVVQFAPDDVADLTAVQKEKLKKLAGPRYNPETELIKMSCESFEHQAQNKRHLSGLVKGLLAAAKDPADTFEDVPLDLRHHRVRAKPRFPPDWRLTTERQAQIAEHRQRAALADTKRAEGGLLVDGKKVIDEYLMQRLAEEQEKQAAAELVAAPKGDRALAGLSRARR